MLLKEKSDNDRDYLSDWPTHYYEIDDIKERETYLLTAIEKNLDSAHDTYRLKLLHKRFGKPEKGHHADSFLHAWMMIMAAHAAGVSIFGKKKSERELKRLLSDLCVLDYPADTPEAKEVLTAEWQNFAAVLISSCAGSKAYCSTLFGMVPIKSETVAKKMAEEIDLVTRRYPALFGMESSILPFRQIVADVFCQKIEHGSTYWDEVVSSYPI